MSELVVIMTWLGLYVVAAPFLLVFLLGIARADVELADRMDDESRAVLR